MAHITREKQIEIAQKYGKLIAHEIFMANNEQTLYEQETRDFVDLLEKELLWQNGYSEDEE